MTVEYKCIDVYKKPENPMEWLPCPRCGLRPLVWEFDNGRFTACGCGTDCYSHWSVRAESIMSVIKRSDNGKSAEVYDIDELKNNWNHWVRTGEILFTPGNGKEKMEAVIREIVPGMPEGNVRHAAELMCTDRMGNMMDIDVYILREEDRPYECHYLKDLLEDRVARIDKMHEDKSYTYNIDDNYWCATCGSHSHKKDSETGYCWHCDTVNWVKEDGADVRV